MIKRIIAFIKRLFHKEKVNEMEQVEDSKEVVKQPLKPHVHYGSCIGKGHLKSHMPNQDYIYSTTKDDAIFSVISDGVSLAYKGIPSKAQHSSKFIATYSAKLFEECYSSILSDDYVLLLLNTIYKSTRKTLINQIDKEDPNYYHATAIMTIYRNHKMFYCYVGDSGLLTIKDQQVDPLIYYEQPSGYVHSILNHEVPEGSGVKEVDGYLMATDGIYYKICDKRYESKYNPYLLNDLIFNYPHKKALTSFLNVLPITITSDDKSVLVLLDCDTFEFDENQIKKEVSIQDIVPVSFK